METPKRTNDVLSVKTLINDVLNDLDLICRVVAEFVTVPKEQRRFGSTLKTGVLADLFLLKAAELEDLWRVAAEQTDRQKLIDCIQHDIEVRNEYIDRLRGCLLEAESVLMNAIFQANLKLKSIKQADLRPVSPDDLVRYAHRISAANSVTAPLTWQQGDPERPFPTDMEMRSGWLSRITGSSEFSAPISTLVHPPVMSSHIGSVDGVHSVPLPNQNDVSPVAPPKLGPTSCWPSPRSAYMSSPRARLANACPSPGGVQIGQRTVRTPTVHNQAVKREIGSTVEDAVEALSSDSSSSSSSDSPS
uniref:Mediator of RNA polymerase II transcription subunit 4 n=1 Tax=Trichuris muris TaxID=70415 RepID=A0A5S6QU79_TRIMR